MKVAIIGSGIVGLTIAYTLSNENIDILFLRKRETHYHMELEEIAGLFTLESTINLKL